MADVNIFVEHLTRVEGHGNIVLNAKDGTVEKVQWQVSEAPRFFESFARGRTHYEMAHVTCRICGICSIGHTEASLKATEAAMGIQLSDQSELLRRLIKAAENLQSHVLHVGYLIAPDLLGVGSVFPLIETHPDAVLKIVKLHRLANEMSDLFAGRTTHPTNMVPGGFTSIPSEKQIKELRQQLVDAVPTFNDVAEIVLANAGALPDFTRETEFIAVTRDDEYAIYDGMIGSTDGGKWPVDQYLSVTNEFVVPYSTAKFTKHNRESYMVGALARFNLNYDLLSPLAKEWAGKFGLAPVCHNPFMNSVAQLIECFNDVETSLAWIDQVLENYDGKNICADYEVKAGRGVSAVDVPRGILFHDYTYNDKGICTKANCIIPTNQNHNNINQDFKAFAPTIIDMPEKDIELLLEMLVRAYDPCISCSCHYLDVTWKR
ncbi:MAG: hydrogenase/sulfur reductase subunit alpha [Candidatus Proteinoplasmatales archaeon SG8-5]|nr:MAG: hydrogenase/sulfur reductase subunit alpha [Candidatus Proteinoplasmatales archaeon SG8-5]